MHPVADFRERTLEGRYADRHVDHGTATERHCDLLEILDVVPVRVRKVPVVALSAGEALARLVAAPWQDVDDGVATTRFNPSTDAHLVIHVAGSRPASRPSSKSSNPRASQILFRGAVETGINTPAASNWSMPW
jgi:hypothetical protein